MKIKELFLQEAKIASSVEIGVGAKTITGTITALDLDTVSIKKDDGRTVTLSLDHMAFFELTDHASGSDPLLSSSTESISSGTGHPEAAVPVDAIPQQEQAPVGSTDAQPAESNAQSQSETSEVIVWNFDRQLAAIIPSDTSEYQKCLDAFNDFKYEESLSVLKLYLQKHAELQESASSLLHYLQEVIERFNNEPTMDKDNLDLYKGIIISKVEKDPDKAIHFLLRAVEAGGERLKTSIYRALIVYSVAQDYEKAADIALQLTEATTTVKPESDQVILWKTMLTIFGHEGRKKEYIAALDRLVTVSESHPVACVNSILRYVTILENKDDYEAASRFYMKALSLDTSSHMIVLRLAGFLLKLNPSGDINQFAAPFLINDVIRREWENVLNNDLAELKRTDDINETIQNKISARENHLEQESATPGRSPERVENYAPLKNESARQSSEPTNTYEEKFLSFRNNGKANEAKDYFRKLEKSDSENSLYRCLSLRAEIYAEQVSQFKRDRADVSAAYQKAMKSWLEDRNLDESETAFFGDIASASASSGASILVLSNMIAVEYGFDKALLRMNELGTAVSNCDREIKIWFYEKKYSFANAADNMPAALNALNALRNLYYNKGKLGQTEFRAAGCYAQNGDWGRALIQYKKAAEYGYMPSFCEQNILRCRANMGELIEANVTEDAAESTVQAPLESIESVQEKIQAFYKELNYKGAYDYAVKLQKDYPEHVELSSIVSETSQTLLRSQELGTTMPRQRDNYGYALRAWKIEGDLAKAKRLFVDEIRSNRPKALQALMNYSEMLLHTEGAKAAVDELKKYETRISKLPPENRVSFYESLYLKQKKADSLDGTTDALKKLLDIYTEQTNERKISYTSFRLGFCLFQQKQYDKVIKYMSYARDHGNPPNPCHSYIVLSYAYLGNRKEADAYLDSLSGQDPQNAIFVSELRKSAKQILDGLEGPSLDEQSLLDDMSSSGIPGINSSFESFFTEKYESDPVDEARDRIQSQTVDNDLIKRLMSRASERKPSDAHKYYGTAAIVERMVNGETNTYYKLFSRAVFSWATALRVAGKWDCAMACYYFVLQAEAQPVQEAVKDIINYLRCIIKSTTVFRNNEPEVSKRDLEDLLTKILDSESEDSEQNIRSLLRLLEKSTVVRDALDQASGEKLSAWLARLSAALGAGQEYQTSDELYSAIEDHFRRERNLLVNFSYKLKSGKVLLAEYVSELRALQNALLLTEADQHFLRRLIDAYEKGVSVYTYDDYDNRAALILEADNQLKSILDDLLASPTLFGVNYLRDIVQTMREVLNDISVKTKSDLHPVLTAIVPVTDVPIVNGKQSISITIVNKENAANARDVSLVILNANNKPLAEQRVAQYIRGGQSASLELAIDSQGEAYTIRLKTTYLDQDEKRCTDENSVDISAGQDTFTEISNPYYAGDAIAVAAKDIFVGRDPLLDNIESALCEDRSSCEIIYGQKRCGKSSIANFLEDRLKNKFITIKFSIGAVTSTKGMYQNIRDNLIDKIEDLIDSSDSPSIDASLLDTIESYPIANDEDFVSFMYMVRRKLCRPVGKQLLIMIDEFTHLYRRVHENRDEVLSFMDTWKKLLEADLFKAVLIGQDTMPDFLREFPNQFRVTQPRRVDCLDKASAEKLIVDPVRLPDHKSRYLEHCDEAIFSWFCGQPYYIQLFCRHLIEQMNLERKVWVTKALVEKEKKWMLEDADETLFDNLISRSDESSTASACYDILKSIADLTRYSEWADIEDIQVENRDALIQDLVSRAVIKKLDKRKRYKILIPFFKEWLNMN